MPSSRRLCLTSSSFELKRYARRRSEKPFLLRTLNLSLSMSSSLRSSSSISSSTISLIWSRNHGSILVSRCTSEREAVLEGIADIPDALRPRLAELLLEGLAVARALVEAVDADLEAAQRLLERLLESAADRHHLAHRLHLGGEPVAGLRELLEREARHLGDHVVDRRLERGRHELSPEAAGDVVGDLVERVAHRELRRHLGDGKARGLGGQG